MPPRTTRKHKKVSALPPKLFHVYANEEQEEEPHRDPRACFHVICSSYAFRSGCGGACSAMDTFPHKVAALENQLDWISDFMGETFYGGTLKKAISSLKAAIKRIEKRGTDEGDHSRLLSIEGPNVGYSTYVSGYYADFVPAALRFFEADLEERMRERAEEMAFDDEGGEEGDLPPESDEQMQNLLTSLERVRKLARRKNIMTEGFVREFMNIGDDFTAEHG